jgi:glycosyltransferase involved in cell wall biosynthesis
MISKNKINEHINQYNNLQVPKLFINNIKYIPNSINYPNVEVKKSWEKPFKIIFVGRDGVEKRIPKIIEVAKLSKQLSLPFTFELIGKFDLSLTNGTNEYIKITNQITDPFILQQEYEEANFIILLSSTEGMPLVMLLGTFATFWIIRGFFDTLFREHYLQMQGLIIGYLYMASAMKFPVKNAD